MREKRAGTGEQVAELAGLPIKISWDRREDESAY